MALVSHMTTPALVRHPPRGSPPRVPPWVALLALDCHTAGWHVTGAQRLDGYTQYTRHVVAVPCHVRVRAGGNPRAKGLQMSTNVQRTGLTGNNWNADKGHNRIQRLFEGEVYQDPGVTARKWNMEQRKNDLTPEGFRYPSMPQKSSGLGGNWGRIGPKLEYMPETEGKRDGAAVRPASAAPPPPSPPPTPPPTPP